MPRILHAADFHLDSPITGLPPDKAPVRRAELRAAFARVIQLAAESRADLLLIAGDIFDNERCYLETAEMVARSLAACPCPVLIAPGNHDPYGGAPYRAVDWPPQVHIFSSPAITAVPFPDLGCVVHGAAYDADTPARPPLRGFRAPDDGAIHLMVLHGEVGGGAYAPVSEEDIAASGLHYLALGHVHTHEGIHQAGRTVYAQPGCPEPRGFDEPGPSGILVGEVRADNVSLALQSVATRRYRILEVPYDEDDPSALCAQLSPSDPRDILRVLLTGAWRVRPPDVAAVTAQLADCAWQLTVRDQTRPDLRARAGEDTLAGLFLRAAAAQREAAATEEERRIVELAVRAGLAALSGADRIL